MSQAPPPAAAGDSRKLDVTFWGAMGIWGRAAVPRGILRFRPRPSESTAGRGSQTMDPSAGSPRNQFETTSM